MPRSRREFLRDAARAGAALAALGPAGAGPRAQPAGREPPAAARPLCLATWDYGLELCQTAQKVFAGGGDLLDALEKGINVVEDDPKVISVGYGGLTTEEGVVQLDAAIMDGRTHLAGAVGALERIRNPISVARKVLERTRHVLLVGPGALAFARKMGFAEQDPSAPNARKPGGRSKDSFWRPDAPGASHDTVCAIAMDKKGDLAVGVSTNGLNGKLLGRLGDSPIVGAGCYVDNEVGAAAATGIGELAMRNVVSFAVVERLRGGVEPGAACREVLERVMHKQPAARTDPKLQLALIAVDKRGRTGAAVIRRQKKAFRFALMTGLETPPALHDVTPLVGA